MQYFYAIVHKDEDSAFGVTFPDIPGCFSAADTFEAIVPNAVEALALWFDDAQEVTPADGDTIRKEAAADLAAGAFLIAVPRIRTFGRNQRVTISLDRGVIQAIDMAAANRQLTRSAFLAEAARNEIENRH